jgi:hypothetical protein
MHLPSHGLNRKRREPSRDEIYRREDDSESFVAAVSLRDCRNGLIGAAIRGAVRLPQPLAFRATRTRHAAPPQWTTRNSAWRRGSAQVCLRTDHAVDDIDARDHGFCIVAHPERNGVQRSERMHRHHAIASGARPLLRPTSTPCAAGAPHDRSHSRTPLGSRCCNATLAVAASSAWS